MTTQKQPRMPRYRLPLPEASSELVSIPRSWDDLEPVSHNECDPEFLLILNECGFGDINPPVPLRARYTRGRRWTRQEFEACFDAWQRGVSLTLIAAALNRNPQDIIYKLLDYCHEHGTQFTERGRSEGSHNWTEEVAKCAERLFIAGLPAWKIAALFHVDFEHVEKQVFLGRSDYGHNKRNPFSINTQHKYLQNENILRECNLEIANVLDAFAGEGNTTTIFSRLFPEARILAIESESSTFDKAQQKVWSSNVNWICEDNIRIIRNCIEQDQTFDLIDLDPFVTCHVQLSLVWPLLRRNSLLFITFGGEYRRSFIASNRKAITARYGFFDEIIDNRNYLEIVPFYFLGWVANLAAENSYTFSVLRAVRYANNCRFWLQVNAGTKVEVDQWLRKHVTIEKGGYRFIDCVLPRFAEVRREIDQKEQLPLFK